jgi:4-hydroxy-2-oxoheptanedioate aldolase
MKNKLFDIWKQEKASINAWLSIPNSFTAEAFGKMGWDSVTVDMQHGQNDYSSSIAMIQALSNSNTVPMTRVPWNEPGIIMKMLDLGVQGIIAPMINTKDDCEKFVSYCYYPPIGQRSFGPMRAQVVYGSDYYQHANKNIVSLAMIETKQAVENLDEILSVPHLTGIYIGPADMSSSYGLPPKFDVREDPVFSNIKMIAKKAKERGKIAGIHNGSVKYMKEMMQYGFQFTTLLSDFRMMTSNAESLLKELKDVDTKSDNTSAY